MKIFRAVLILALLLAVRAEAKELPVIGVVDFTSRVSVTNLSDEQILTFHPLRAGGSFGQACRKYFQARF